MTNDPKTDVASNSSSISEEKTDQGLHPYHQPTLVDYGNLAAIVGATHGIGSDGGAADCSHA